MQFNLMDLFSELMSLPLPSRQNVYLRTSKDLSVEVLINPKPTYIFGPIFLLFHIDHFHPTFWLIF
jgi:hypothetical protein